MRICVFGAASDEIAQEFTKAAFILGTHIARNGHTLVFGAGATGVMGAVYRGVCAANGQSIGVAPRFFDQEGVLVKDCAQLIFTDTMRERKQTMESLSDAFIMAPGGIGTLDEFFEILTLRQLKRHAKPVAVLNTQGYYDPLEKMLDHVCALGFLSTHCRHLYGICKDPEEVVRYVQMHAASQVGTT